MNVKCWCKCSRLRECVSKCLSLYISITSKQLSNLPCCCYCRRRHHRQYVKCHDVGSSSPHIIATVFDQAEHIMNHDSWSLSLSPYNYMTYPHSTTQLDSWQNQKHPYLTPTAHKGDTRQKRRVVSKRKIQDEKHH